MNDQEYRANTWLVERATGARVVRLETHGRFRITLELDAARAPRAVRRRRRLFLAELGLEDRAGVPASDGRRAL